MQNELQLTINRLLAVSGKNLTQVAEHSGLDRAYCLRLAKGGRSRPSPEALVKLFLGIVFDGRLVEKDPTILHGLSELLLAAAMVAAAEQSSEG